MIRIASSPARVLVLLSVLALAGCGFHLRDRIALPSDAPPVRVLSSTPYSTLVTLLERNLRNAGAKLAEEDGEGKYPEDVLRLEVLSERWGDLPIAIDQAGRAQEFSLRYATVFTAVLSDGTVLVPQQSVELARDYVSPPQDATGTSTEREILAEELRREMAASILRRLDSVVRADPSRARPSHPVPDAPGAPIDATGVPGVQDTPEVPEVPETPAEIPQAGES
ncbi:LPS-assembly lipoprotein LptE [Pseudoxanthomonas suwonensis]|jgi:Rare lipoprotein B